MMPDRCAQVLSCCLCLEHQERRVAERQRAIPSRASAKEHSNPRI